MAGTLKLTAADPEAIAFLPFLPRRSGRIGKPFTRRYPPHRGFNSPSLFRAL